MLAAAELNMVATGEYAFFNVEIFTGDIRLDKNDNIRAISFLMYDTLLLWKHLTYLITHSLVTINNV
ncbi:hypothetical protein E2C01_036811 [Portunus trituberculatus]|uniref:Uncharacterized protein n=1 Tax=Portunus trituberculatus TaxID=210409 RepID=A0A5B7FDG8_PORTR|nr:hypothetical protein [Portunus trituberculatus]